MNKEKQNKKNIHDIIIGVLLILLFILISLAIYINY